MKTAIAFVCLCLALLHATPALAILTGSAPPLPKPETTLARAPAQTTDHGSNMASDSNRPAAAPAGSAASASATLPALPSALPSASASIPASATASAPTMAPTMASPTSASPVAPPAAPAPPATHAAPVSNLLQVISALIVVLLLMFGCAWLLKNHGPRRLLARVPTRIIGGVNLGGRERILVVEVGDQWLVVGSTPTQINLLTTLPRQENLEDEPIPGKQFSVWLKQVMEKRNG